MGAAAHLVAEGSLPSIAAVADRAGVSRITVYNRFGSRAGLLAALAPHPAQPGPVGGDPTEALRQHFFRTSSTWAANPGLFRHLPRTEDDAEASRRLAETLAAADALRLGSSIREAADVIGALSSFSVFDRLHKDGRRSPAAVGEILMRLVGAILA